MDYKVFCSAVIENTHNEVLLVQEKAAPCYGQWNFPGGHVEIGEKLLDCVRREVREEVGLDFEPTNLLGIYTQKKTDIHGIFFVFYGKLTHQDQKKVAQPEEILSCRWWNRDAITRLPDTEILNPKKFRKIIADWQTNQYHDLAMIHELL